jgi:hypothetical protein
MAVMFYIPFIGISQDYFFVPLLTIAGEKVDGFIFPKKIEGTKFLSEMLDVRRETNESKT